MGTPATGSDHRGDATSSVTALVRRWARERAGSLALVDAAAPRTWTWRELSVDADRAAGLLAGLGVGPGAVVAIQLPNRGEAVVAALATLRLGAACCMLDPRQGPREVRQALRRAGALALVVTDEGRERLYGPAAVPVPGAVVAARLDAAGGDLAWRPMADVGPAPPVDSGRPDLYGQLAFTSGTTGEAKCVLHRVATLTTAVRLAAARLRLTEADRVFVPCPLAHHSGFLYGTWLAWTLGCTQVVQGAWDVGRALATMRRWEPTFAQLATPMAVDLADAIEAGEAPPPPLRACVLTGGPVPARLARRSSRALRSPVCRAWGSTETCMGTLSEPDAPPSLRCGTDGQPLDGVRVRITDNRGRQIGPRQMGGLEVDGTCLFPGYGLGPDFDRSRFTADGWYRTGDLAVRDEAGFLRVIGRAADVVNRGGEKLPVAEIEALLAEHEAVAEVAITGLRDRRLGERACAFVVPGPGRRLGLADLQRYLDRRGVTRWYWPERLEVVERLPRNGAGKVEKALLRQSVETADAR